MYAAQSQYSHYSNAPVGLNACHDLLQEVYMLQPCNIAVFPSAIMYSAALLREYHGKNDSKSDQ